MFRFIHTSDLHIGKAFGQFEEELRVPLRQARLDVVEKIAQLAQQHEASHIFIAGDIFDTGTPNERALHQFLSMMRNAETITWVLLPGNHDSLNCEVLWQKLADETSDNVILAIESQPVELTEQVLLLPAPCRVRRHGEDTTAWMDPIPIVEGQIRIGLAHGPIHDFSEGDGSEVISPDRAGKAGLHYLALGDWHGQIMVNDRTWYSGAPEPDRFKHDSPGQCLLVTIEGPDATPSVTSLETGKYQWRKATCTLLPDDEVEGAVHQVLPEPSAKQTCLLQLTVNGRATLSGQSALETLVARERLDLAFLELRNADLHTEIGEDDLTEIDLSGSLRLVAETLQSEMNDDSLNVSDRKVAELALRRLYSLSMETGE